MTRLDCRILEEIDIALGRAADHRGVSEQNELLASQRPGPHEQPRGLGPVFHQSDEQSDHQPDDRKAHAAAHRRLVGRSQEHVDRIKEHAPQQPTQHAPDHTVDDDLAVTKCDALAKPCSNRGDGPSRPAPHHQDQEAKPRWNCFLAPRRPDRHRHRHHHQEDGTRDEDRDRAHDKPDPQANQR
jgi:hypothetical protein